MCTVRCPRGVKPTEIAHALESLAYRKGFRIDGTSTPAMYSSFVSSIKGNGRVHEFGMMLRYYLTTNPLAALKLLSVGTQLLLHKRMPLMPKRAKGRDELAKIIKEFRTVRSTQ